MPLFDTLQQPRCPHCSIDKPNLKAVMSQFSTFDDTKRVHRDWRVYVCQRCGGPIIAGETPGYGINEVYPSIPALSDVIPTRVHEYLKQAIESTFAPSGSVMLCACAVDAILKERGYKEGKLYTRIKKAIDEGILTEDMGKWAHQIRLDANDERHADEDATMPTVENARQSIEFAKTLAELLFVLPSKVTRGIADTTTTTIAPTTNPRTQA